MAEPADPDGQLEELCGVLNYFGVAYIVFGSHVARLNGVPLETIDVDCRAGSPGRQPEPPGRGAQPSAAPVAGGGLPEGMKIDGGLEARHFLGDSAVVGLVTRLGPVSSCWSQGLRGGLHRSHREVDEGAPGRRRVSGRRSR